jgi:hypothetical protein
MDLSQVSWRKSSRSNANGGQCVEVGVWNKSARSGNDPDHVDGAPAVASGTGRLYLIRDSKIPQGAILAVTPSEWGTFLECVESGRFEGSAS